MSDLSAGLPLILVAAASLVTLLVAAFQPKDRAVGQAVLMLLVFALIGVVIANWDRSATAPRLLWNGMVHFDLYSLFFTAIVGIMLLGAVALSAGARGGDEYAHGEFWPLLALSASGMILLASAANLVVLFLGIELMSIPVYCLVASDRGRLTVPGSVGVPPPVALPQGVPPLHPPVARSPEGAIKYFLLGSFSSAFLLFGIAFLYGATAHLDYQGIAASLRSAMQPGQKAEVILGMAMLAVGLLFKTSSAPFHWWAPDAYSAAPTPVTAFMGSAVKASAFAAFIRLFAFPLGPESDASVLVFWSNLIGAAAVVSVVVGNLGAIAQTEIKRLLAYSGVAHAGYLLIGLRAASISPIPATSALAYYLLAYTFTVLGAFGAVVAMERILGKEPTLDDLAGFSRRHPALSAALALFMITLAGVPPTAGFTAKLVVFGAAVRAGDYGLAVLGVLASAVSLYYYLRVVVVMYMREPDGSRVETPGRFPSVGGVVAVAAAAVLVLGVGPWYLTTTDAVGGAAGAHLASP